MKKKNLLLLSAFVICFLFTIFLGEKDAYAAGTVSVSPSSTSVTVGQEIVIRVSLADSTTLWNGNLQVGNIGLLDYKETSLGDSVNSDSLEGNVVYFVTNKQYWDIHFIAKQEGEVTFSFVGGDFTLPDYTNMEIDGGPSCSVRISATPTQPPLSSDSLLTGLDIGVGSLAPAFSPNVYSYNVNLPNFQTSLSVTPKIPQGASYTISGNASMHEGQNTIQIVVLSEDKQNKSTYTITVNNPSPPTEAPTEGTTAEPDSTEATSQEESTSETESVTQSGTSSEGESTTEEPKGLVAFEKNGKVYTVAENFNQPLPDGFSETFYAYHDKQVKIGQSSGGVILMFVTDESGAGDFYVYNEQTKQFTPYVSLTTAIQTFIWDAKPDSVKVPSGFAETQITVGGKQVTAWKNQNGSLLVYVTTLDGKSGLYRFDQESTSFFPYVPDSVSGDDGGVPKEAYESMEAQYNQEHSKSIKVYIFLIILIVLLLAAIICLVVLYNKHKGGNGPDGGYDDGPYDDYDDGYNDEYYDDEYGQDEGIQDDYAGEEEGILSDMASDGQSADEGTGSGRPSDISQEKRYAAQPSVKRDAAFGDTEEIDLESLSRALSSNIDLGEQPAPESDKKSASGDDFEFMDV